MNPKSAYWMAIAVVVLASLLTLWINLAVGIIGEPEDPANLLYVAVLFTGAVGAVVARFRPMGMSRVLAMMVLLQALVATITLTAGLGYPPTPPLSYLILNLMLITFWCASGWLFRRAARP